MENHNVAYSLNDLCLSFSYIKVFVYRSSPITHSLLTKSYLTDPQLLQPFRVQTRLLRILRARGGLPRTGRAQPRQILICSIESPWKVSEIATRRHTHCLTLTGKGCWASGVIIGVMMATLRVVAATLIAHFCKK
jgi:hypothetical protein